MSDDMKTILRIVLLAVVIATLLTYCDEIQPKAEPVSDYVRHCVNTEYLFSTGKHIDGSTNRMILAELVSQCEDKEWVQ